MAKDSQRVVLAPIKMTSAAKRSGGLTAGDWKIPLSITPVFQETSALLTKPCEKYSKGKVQLVFLDEAAAKKSKAAEGANARVCLVTGKPGYLFPVRTANDALRVARAARDCAPSKDYRACLITKTGAKGPGLGRHRR